MSVGVWFSCGSSDADAERAAVVKRHFKRRHSAPLSKTGSLEFSAGCVVFMEFCVYDLPC